MWKSFKLFKLVRAQRIGDLDGQKDQCVCWLSTNVSRLASPKLQIPCFVSFFYLVGKIAFSIKVRDRLPTELHLANPLETTRQSPFPCNSSKPPIFTQTHTSMPLHWHSDKQTKTPPPPHCSAEAYSHTKSYLTWAFTQNEHFPAVPLHRGNIVTNNPGVELVSLKGDFTL